MQILVLGSGGREHALVWKLAQSRKVDKIFVAPGNGGMCKEGAEAVTMNVDDVEGIVAFAKEKKIDLVVPGPELPLTLGIVDAVTKNGIACFGPDAYAARLEGSKSFAKEIMRRAGVPTASYRVVTTVSEAKAYVDEVGAPIVVKADGLAAGKGVVVARTREEAFAAIDEMLGQ
ncbi:MAG: ATP-grasp domain-containing protein, partial [Desulfovibrio sp.]|nr:ATP-grasp domain-containing protein [Desulfovibrio sp.]